MIDFLRGAEHAATYVRDDLLRGRVCVSAMTVFELRSGARSARQQQAVEALLAATQVVAIDGAVASLAGDWFRDLKAGGQQVGAADCLIGATCSIHQAQLVTRNQRHFKRMSSVMLSSLAER